VFAGIWVFGLSGVVYGPVFVNIVPVIYRALKYRLLYNTNREREMERERDGGHQDTNIEAGGRGQHKT
jgi:predicted PurR-regulated permease PerM